ncbi:MAG: crotonase/enoyl-CoA hydratase family protein [Hyphomonadaceae bacterium]|nr:crotonase/enoyl-CoA hydratase family protein [Hyphomonadaceae bacterium]
MTAPATIEIKDEIAILTMDDGKANAINPPMLEALNACLDQAEKEAKVLIITGREGRFSGGFDLKLMMSLPGPEVKALVDGGGKLAHRLYGFPMPVIAACNGHGVAMGSFILLSSDVRIGTAGAFKIGANETQINMVLPIFASELVKARVDQAYLTRSMVFGELFDPETAVKVGYLDQVVDAGDLLSTAKATAEALKPLSGSSLTGNKRLLRETTLATIGASLPD